MARSHTTLESGSSPEVIGAGRPPRRFWRLKAALTMLLVMSAAIGLVIAALVLGSIIAGIILVVTAIGLVAFSIKRLFSPLRRRVDPRY